MEPFPREQIENVIVKPAARVHVEVTRELLEQLKQETPTTDALPLLAFTLEKLYRAYAADKKLDLSEYKSLGGMEGSIRHTAEQIMPANSLPPNVESAVRLSFVQHLAQVNEKDEFVRLTARWKDLDPVAYPILEQFVAQRLLIKSERDGDVTLEVAHEALFRSWEQLKTWLGTSADILRWRRDVRRDQSSDKKWHGLRPAQLEVARVWPKRRRNELSDDEVKWIKQAIRRKSRVRGTIAVVTVLITSLVAAAAYQHRIATDANLLHWRSRGDVAFESAIGAMDVQAIKQEIDPIRSAHFFLRSSVAFAKANEAERSRNMAFAGHAQAASVSKTLPLEGQVAGIRLCADGRHVVAWGHADRASTIAVWNWRTGEVKLNRSIEGQVHDVRIDSNCLRFVIIRNNAGDTLFESGIVAENQELQRIFGVSISPLRSWISTDLGRLVVLGLYGEVRRWTSGVCEESTIGKEDREYRFHPDIPFVLTISRESKEATLSDLRHNAPGSALGKVTGAEFDTGTRERLVTWNSEGMVTIHTAGGPNSPTLLHHAGVQRARFSADGKRLVTWGSTENEQAVIKNKPSVIVWDINERKELQQFNTTNGVVDLVLNRNATLIVGWNGSQSWLWREGTATPIALGRGESAQSSIGGACFCAADQFVATWMSNGTRVERTTIPIWPVGTGSAEIDRPIHVLKHHGIDKTYRQAFARAEALAGDTLLTYGSDGLVRVWNLKTDQSLMLPGEFDEYDEITAFHIAKSGEYLAATLDRGGPLLWNAMTGDSIPTPFDSDSSVKRVLFAPDDAAAIAWKSDGSAQSWKIGTDHVATPLPDVPQGGSLLEVTDNWMIGRHGDTTAAWHAQTGRKLRELRHIDQGRSEVVVEAASLNADGTHALTWAKDGVVQWWSSQARLEDLQHKLEGEAAITGAALSRDGTRAVTRSLDVYCWDLKRGKRASGNLQPVILPHDRAFGVAGQDLSPIGALFTGTEENVLTWHYDGYARLWNFSTGELIREFQQERIFIDGIQIRATMSNDESLLLTSSPGWSRSPTRLWDVESGRVIREFDAHGGVFSADTTKLFVFEKRGIRIIPLHVSKSPLELERDLREFQVRSATEVTDTGELRVLSKQQWNDRRQLLEPQ